MLSLLLLNAAAASPRIVSMKACPLLVHFAMGNTNFFGDRYILRLGIDTSSRAKGFLGVDTVNGHTNTLVGFYELSSDDFTPPLSQIGEFSIDLPPFVDDDHDGIHDFFEQKSAFTVVQTSGTFRDSVGGPHVLLATWSRAADSGNEGIVEFEMASQALGITITFRTTFEVYYFTGSLTYTPGASSGTATLYRFNEAQQFFTGNLPFSRGPINGLALGTFGLIDDEGLRAMHYSIESVSPSGGVFTGILHFIYDTDRFLIGPNYSMPWQVVIYDPLLADILPTPRPPGLSLTGSSGSYSLQISGNPGSSYTLEQSPDGLKNWSNSQTVKLTGNSLSTPFTPGNDATRFYRLRTP